MLKTLLLRSKLDAKKKELEELRKKDNDFKKREKELEDAISEMTEETTEEDRKTVEDQAEDFEQEKKDHEDAKKELEETIEEIEGQIEEEEKRQKQDEKKEERKEERTMETRKKFFGMSIQERDAFFAREDVKRFLERTREIGTAAASQKRTVTGADLTIPEVVLDLIRENIMAFSKLAGRVRLRKVPGKARQNIMGTIPEAIWTEMCANLNELDFSFNQTEVDGYKVGGVIYICKATLEDSDLDLAEEIITALGVAIGIALDKAVLYGNGTKMPLGIVPRLAQEEAPSDYPANEREWEDLSGNLVTISADKHGIEFFKAITQAAGKMKSKYSMGVRFWAMNETTKTTITVESMNFNSAGAIVAVQEGTMPVVGGDIVTLSDDIIKDGNIVAGFGDLYLLAERKGSAFERSDQYRFAEDQVAFKGTARYDGKPAIPEGFVAIGIGSAPEESAVFAGDKANDASLAGLEVGAETLAPVFDAGKTAYTITASAASGAVTASPSQGSAKITLSYQDKNYPNGGTIKWVADGKAHPLTITVKNGASKMTYTVAVTKAS